MGEGKNINTQQKGRKTMSNEKMLTGREVDQKFGMYSGYVNHVRYAFPEYINAIRDPLKGGGIGFSTLLKQ